MQKLIAAFLIAVLFCSCGQPEFASEQEETAYLSSLSNPSVSQWKRKNELAKKATDKEIEMRKQWKEQNESYQASPKYKKQELERTTKETKRKRDELLKIAADFERDAQMGPASLCYKEFVSTYPDDPQAKHAAERYKACYELAYGKKPPDALMETRP